MKTVLFIDKGEKGLWPSFLRYDFLLDEFVKEGAFVVCDWHSGGLSVASAIPGLAGILGDESDWRAVIVSDLRQGTDVLRDDRHFDNPFDFEDRYDVGVKDGLRESSHAVVRLTHMLGGFPEKAFIRWPDEDADVFHLKGYEVDRLAIDDRYDMIERYRLGLPRPSRIICVTPRDADDAFFDLRSQEVSLVGEKAALDFWQRNDYPHSARFVVCDRPAPAVDNPSEKPMESERLGGGTEKGAFSRDPWFAFWMSVLVLITSNIDPFDLQAFKVYNMRVNIDERILTDMLAHRRAQWTAALRAIGDRFASDAAKLRPSEYVMTPMPETNVTIPVDFDQVKTTNLYSDPFEVRFVRDDPESDLGVWFRQKTRITTEFKELLRAPRRALRGAANRFRETRSLSFEELEYCVLNEYQNDGLRDGLRAQECELASDVGRPPFEYDSHEKRLEEKADAIVAQIGLRPNRKQSVAILGIALGCLFIGFIPYMFGLAGGLNINLASLLVTLGCCAVLACVGVLTLLRMREDVRNRYRDYNDEMSEIVSTLSSEARRLERKASSYATFRRRWSVYDRQCHLEIPTREADALGRRAALLKARIRDIDAIARDCEIAMADHFVGFDPDWETVSHLLEDDAFYSLCNVSATKSGDSERSHVRCSFRDLPYEFIESAELRALAVR